MRWMDNDIYPLVRVPFTHQSLHLHSYMIHFFKRNLLGGVAVSARRATIGEDAYGYGAEVRELGGWSMLVCLFGFCGV